MKREKADNLPEEVKKAGFKSIDDFIKANLHYLPKSTQRIFHIVNGLGKTSQHNDYREKNSDKSYYRNNQIYNGSEGGYSGKG
jgi:hypothetical protein